MTWGGGATSLHTCSVTEQPRCLAFKCLKASEKSSTWGDAILKLTRGGVCLLSSFPLGKTSLKKKKLSKWGLEGGTHKTISAGGRPVLQKAVSAAVL